ncbi:MAG: DegV family protein [Caldilineaceae bacterium]|nr:DegV family protein [Caldilineaceae bacterium]
MNLQTSDTRVRMVVDTSSSMPPDLLAQFNILEVPTTVHFGSDDYQLNRDIDLPKFFELLQTRPEHPTTSQPAPALFAEAYRQAVADGAEEILVVVVSSELSGTWNSARLAIGEVPEADIELWDSRFVSISSGLQAIAAAQFLATGGARQDAIALLGEVQSGLSTYLTVDNLDALARSGRVGGLQKNMGNMLNLKPILTVVDGKVIPVAKARGRRKAVSELLKRTVADQGDRPVVVAVSHAKVPDEADELLEKARSLLTVDTAHIVELDPVIVALAGIGTLGIAAYPVDAAA